MEKLEQIKTADAHTNIYTYVHIISMYVGFAWHSPVSYIRGANYKYMDLFSSCLETASATLSFLIDNLKFLRKIYVFSVIKVYLVGFNRHCNPRNYAKYYCH